MRDTRIFRGPLLTVLLALFLTPAARAANVTVGCGVSGTFDYSSITAALNAIGSGPGTITVTGTCNENVSINDARSITIAASAPGAATVVGPLDTDAFDISVSQDIHLVNLEIDGTFSNTGNGGGAGVIITDASQVEIAGCTVQGNQVVGVDVDTNSILGLHDSTIQNNNPNDGLDVTLNSFADVFRTTIQNNGNSQVGGVGVAVFDSSNAIFRNRNSILNNADFGIQVLNLSSVGISTGAPNRFTTIQGHNVNGIFVRKQSELQINNFTTTPHVITGNGASCPLDPSCGGIFVENNSTVHVIAGATVSGNQGSGISVQQGANLILGSDLLLNGPATSNNTISNNTGDGVHIQWMSVGDFLTANSITGNGGSSVSCDNTSLAVGTLSGFSKVGCARIAQSSGSQHPGSNR